jgi:hypothetical protein
MRCVNNESLKNLFRSSFDVWPNYGSMHRLFAVSIVSEVFASKRAHEQNIVLIRKENV